MVSPNRLAIIGLLVAVCLVAHAQRDQVAIELVDAPFESLVAQVERQSAYRFYYDRAQTDGVIVNVPARRWAIDELLKAALSPHRLFYSIDVNKRIFITENYALINTLPSVSIRDTAALREPIPLPPVVGHQQDERAADISIQNRLFEIGSSGAAQSGTKTLSGYIRSTLTGAPVSLASVQVVGHSSAVQADQFGYYSITIPAERSVIRISSVGKKATQRQLLMHASGRLDIQLDDEVYALKEVIVSAEQGSQVRRTQLGVERLSIQTIKQVPVVFGEADVVRVVLTLPGVQTVGEAASGFNVRGGATDQNLVLFNDATVYNPAHFFGFFSAFNPDAISGVELYKGSVPPKFGGRLSSVLDVAAKTGNRNKVSGAGGIGPLTGRLSLDGPIGEKTSFFVAGRSTYSDWLLRLIPDEGYKNSGASFYDANVQLNHEFGDKDALYLTGYISNDRFAFDTTSRYGYENLNLNLKWKRIFSTEAYGMVTVGYDGYRFNVSENLNKVNGYRLDYAIGQTFVRADVNHRLGRRHNLTYGLQAIHYRLTPGNRIPVGERSLIDPAYLAAEQGVESALYVSDSYEVDDRLTLDLGLRYSMFNYLGPRRVDYYAPGLPKSENTIVDTREFGSGQFIKTYHAPEFRLSARYALSPNSSVKAGYNSLRQYIHMLSNTTAITPTDTWKLSDAHIKPQFGDQASLGYYQNFRSNTIETSVELYYKRMHDYLDYKSGAVLLMNERIETDVIDTEARAYGIEFLVKKLSGKLNGWASYTYSRVEQRTVGVNPGDMINRGAYYPSNFDKPHNLTMIGNYKFSHRYSFSLNLTYSTGRPITLPVAVYQYAGSERVYYSDRNQYRIPDFFRADASFNVEGNHKIKKLAHSSWTFGVYNVTGRRNPFSVYYVAEEGRINGYKLSIFGHQIPFVTYNFRF